MRKPGSKGAPTDADFKSANEEVELGEGIDKNHPIVKEYNALKKHDIKTLRGLISQNSRVADTSDFKTKDHAISHLLRQRHGHKKVDSAFGFNEETELQEAQKPMGKKIGTVNGFHIHDLGADTPHKNKRFLAYHHEYAFISHTAPTKTEINKKSEEREESKPTQKRTEHDDWRDDMKRRISSGEVSRAVMSKRGMREEIEVEESNNTPFVKPHIEKGSTKQSGWKASNKHGNVKYFGMDFKKSAEKHAGIAEGKDPDANTKLRRKVQNVERDSTPETIDSDASKPTDPCSDHSKQQRIMKKTIMSEEGNVQSDPKKRLMGTDSLVKAYKKDTPGESLDESFAMAFDYQGKPSVGPTASELHMKAQGGFAHHTDVQNVMEVTEIKQQIQKMFETTILEEDKDQLALFYSELSDMVEEAFNIITKIKTSTVERDAWSEAEILKMERYIQSVDAYLKNMYEDVVSADKKGEVVAGHKVIKTDPKTREQIVVDVPSHVRKAATGKKIIKSGNPNDGIPG